MLKRIGINCCWLGLITCLVLWIISLQHIYKTFGGRTYTLFFESGDIGLVRSENLVAPLPDEYGFIEPPYYGYSFWPGWAYDRSSGCVAVTIPLWIPIALLLAGIMDLKVRPIWRRQRRQRENLCIDCGYDLRASMDRCPECGLAFAGYPIL